MNKFKNYNDSLCRCRDPSLAGSYKDIESAWTPTSISPAINAADLVSGVNIMSQNVSINILKTGLYWGHLLFSTNRSQLVSWMKPGKFWNTGPYKSIVRLPGTS